MQTTTCKRWLTPAEALEAFRPSGLVKTRHSLLDWAYRLENAGLAEGVIGQSGRDRRYALDAIERAIRTGNLNTP